MKTLADVQGRGIIQATQTEANTGGAEAAANLFSGLAQTSRRLRQQLQPLLDQQASNRATQDVREAAASRENGLEAPDVPLRLALTRQDQIYNQVVQAGVLATSKSDMQDALNDLRAKHKFDPEAFTAEANEYIEGYTSGLSKRNLDIELLQAVELDAKNAFAAEGSRITETVRVLQTKETQDALERRMSQVNAEVATLLEREGLNAVNGDEYAQLESEFVDMIDILVENPIYGWSAERGAEAVDGLLNSATEIVAGQGLEAVYHKDGAAAALKYIDGAVNGMTLDQQERIGARSRLSQNLSVLQQMTALERAEAKRTNDETIEKLKLGARSFEADVLMRLGKGEKPTEGELGRMKMYVKAGAMTPTRMQTYVNAATAEEPSVSNDLNVAALFDYARSPGTTRDEIEQQSLAGIINGDLTWADRERVLDEYSKSQDDRFTAGTDALNGYFATGMMDIDTGAVKAAKAEAEAALGRWYQRNPEASADDVARQAKTLAVEYGRRMPKPPKPVIPNFRSPTVVNITNVDQWHEDALLAAVDAYGDDPAELERVGQLIDNYQAYLQDQQRFQQENINAPE